MELYTEEQVIQMIESSYLHGFERAHDYKDVKEHILKSVPPIKLQSVTTIELPSDEEIESKSSNEYQEQKQSYENSVEMFPIDFGNYLEVGFIEGAKWMRDKIGGNK